LIPECLFQVDLWLLYTVSSLYCLSPSFHLRDSWSGPHKMPLSEGHIYYTTYVTRWLTFMCVQKCHCHDRGQTAPKQSGIISRRKPAQSVLVAAIPGLATCCLGPLGSVFCYWLWVVLSSAEQGSGIQRYGVHLNT
jgi:hypothetical protein